MMLIAVASETPDLEGVVPPQFAGSPYLLLVDLETGGLLHSLPRGAGGDMAFAREIVRRDCEGLLCGPLEEAPFLVIADEGCVSRYNAAGLSVKEALEGLSRRALPLIREYIGGAGCQSHGGGSCADHG